MRCSGFEVAEISKISKLRVELEVGTSGRSGGDFLQSRPTSMALMVLGLVFRGSGDTRKSVHLMSRMYLERLGYGWNSRLRTRLVYVRAGAFRSLPRS